MADPCPILSAAAALVFVISFGINLGECMGPDEVPFTSVVNATEKLAVCMDGSPAGYHHAIGYGSGLDNWVVYLQGGGWCPDITDCQGKRSQYLGSSVGHIFQNLTGMLSNREDVNPDFYNCNRIFVVYCDQSSFLGDTEVVDQGPRLQFRGSRIFDAVIDDLVAKGMGRGKNAILTGVSAGGLATILQCDHFRARLPSIDRLKCIADAGFFLRAKDLPNADFREQFFASTIKFHNLTSFLPTSCTAERDPTLCLFAEYLVENVRTPLFLSNSAFDNYQIVNNLEPLDSSWNICTNHFPPNCTLDSQNKLIKDFGIAFVKTIKGIPDIPSRGLFINTCYIHVFIKSDKLWSSTSFFKRDNNLSLSQAVSNWYFGPSPIKVIEDPTTLPRSCN